MIKKQVFQFLLFTIFLQSFVISQDNQFLEKIGILDSIYSNKLTEYREIYVQLPPSYDPTNNQKYPVVYVLDGEVFLPSVNNVQNFYSGGFMPEMVIVGISNTINRIRDLTTSEVTELYGRPFELQNGKASDFINFIQTELIPFVEHKYPVTNFRTLIGHSYGGLFTIYTLLNHPDLFSNYIAIDPSLDWDNQKILEKAREKLLKNNYSGKSLFMSLGGQLHMQNPDITIENVMLDSSDFTLFPRANIAFSNIVEQNRSSGLNFKWKHYPNDLHGTIALPSIMDGLIFDFQWFQMEKTEKFNSPLTSKEELLTVVNHRATKLKNYFGYAVPPYPEELLNMSGYMSLDMAQLEKSKMFFELAIKYYPQSANTYDSMADYYESTDDYKKALHYATKAYEISGYEHHGQRIEKLEEEISQINKN